MLAVAAALGALATVARAAWSDGDAGVNRMYGDLPNMPFSSASASSCYSSCMSNSACAAWVFNTPGSLCWLKNQVMPPNYDPNFVSGVKNTTLVPRTYEPMPLSVLQVHSWTRQWLQVQANGLAGHLQLFWPDIENSTWIGGSADGGLHERLPYDMNGFIPMAYMLNDQDLIAQADRIVQTILAGQTADGWMGPDDSSLGGNMFWSRFPLMLAFVQYAQLNQTAAPQVLTATVRLARAIQLRMFNTTLGDSWAGARWQDAVLSFHWLLEHYADNQEQMLWDVASMMQQQGFDWGTWFTEQIPTGPVPPSETTLYSHGVNNGQAIKAPSVWYRQSADPSDAAKAIKGTERLYQYHGLPHGVFGCDEHLAGNMPSRGTELCTVVETSFSIAEMHSILGEPQHADLVERIILNALPGEMTADFWAHQYLQQTNQWQAVSEAQHVWATDGPDAILFGLEPNYGCCTANHGQGLPKFLERALFFTQDGGVAVIQLIPMAAVFPSAMLVDRTMLHVPHDLISPSDMMSINVTGAFPFLDDVTITVTNPPAGMPLHVRIPGWATAATLSINGAAPIPATAGSVAVVTAPAAGQTLVVVLHTNPQISIERGYNGAASVYRGPLLYALPIAANVQVLNHYAFNSTDMALNNAQAWNYALVASDSNPSATLTFNTTGQGAPTPFPFGNGTESVWINAQIRSLPSWGLDTNSVAAPPASPACGSACGPVQPARLVPYGATNLRIAAFPTA